MIATFTVTSSKRNVRLKQSPDSITGKDKRKKARAFPKPPFFHRLLSDKPGRTFFPSAPESRSAKRIRVKEGEQAQAVEIVMMPSGKPYRISGIVTSTVGTLATLSLVAHNTDVPDDPVIYGSRNIGTMSNARSS
jgi:hypothetical protein